MKSISPAILIQKHCRELQEEVDGTRILVMRFWPRGVRKSHFDEWHRDLAPSADLFKWCQTNRGQLDHETFTTAWQARYRAQMSAQRDLIKDLKSRHQAGETLTLLCGCHDPAECHRSVLADLILQKED